jgi:hypothetical protein
MKFEIRKGDDKITEPEMIPTRFKQFVHKKGKRRGKLNQLSPKAKVVAALSKALAIQGKRDKQNYYVDGDKIWCPDITATGDDEKQSIKAKGRFRIGKIGETLTFGIMSFNITFRDAKDGMGLPDLVIESATMTELDKSAPLKG